MLDRSFRAARVEFEQAEECGKPCSSDAQDRSSFPIERARLGHIWWLITLLLFITVAYGFSLKTHIAVPLTCQFIGMKVHTQIGQLTDEA